MQCNRPTIKHNSVLTTEKYSPYVGDACSIIVFAWLNGRFRFTHIAHSSEPKTTCLTKQHPPTHEQHWDIMRQTSLADLTRETRESHTDLTCLSFKTAAAAPCFITSSFRSVPKSKKCSLRSVRGSWMKWPLSVSMDVEQMESDGVLIIIVALANLERMTVTCFDLLEFRHVESVMTHI